MSGKAELINPNPQTQTSTQTGTTSTSTTETKIEKQGLKNPLAPLKLFKPSPSAVKGDSDVRTKSLDQGIGESSEDSEASPPEYSSDECDSSDESSNGFGVKR